MSKFTIGQMFTSYEKFCSALERYEKNTFSKFWKRDSRKITAIQHKINHPMNPSLIYYEIRYCCIMGGVFRKRGRGIRNTSTLKMDCPVYMSLRVTSDGKFLQIKSMNVLHNHETTEVLYNHVRHRNQYPKGVKEKAKASKINKKLLHKKLQIDSRKIVTLEDISALAECATSLQSDDLVEGVNLVMEKYDADMEILTDKSNYFTGLFFQTRNMKHTVDAFPEFLVIHVTCSLSHLKLPTYIFLVEDGNCQSEIVAIGVLVQNDCENLEWLLSVFKNGNFSSSKTKIVITNVMDKLKRSVLEEMFQEARISLNVFDAFKQEKFEMTHSLRSSSSKLLKKLVEARSDELFDQLLLEFNDLAPYEVQVYYYENWHDIRSEWMIGEDSHKINLQNSIVFRVEALNSELNSVISENSSFVEFLDSLFSLIATLEHERDHASVLMCMKRPTPTNHPDSADQKYKNLLSVGPFKYLMQELEACKATEKCDLQEGTTTDSCTCSFYRSMLLPCRHIFAIRQLHGTDLYNEELCSIRWQRKYFLKYQQKIRPMKEKNAQERRKVAISVTDNLVDVISVVNTEKFEEHLELLKKLMSYWEKGVDVEIVPKGGIGSMEVEAGNRGTCTSKTNQSIVDIASDKKRYSPYDEHGYSLASAPKKINLQPVG